MIHNKICIFIVLLVLQLCNMGNSEPEFVSSFCMEKNGTYTSKSQYRNNLSVMFRNLTSASSRTGFSNFSVGEGLNKVYGLFYCRGDLNLSDCHGCVQTATSRIVFECPNEKEAIIFFDECTLRFANRSFFSIEEEQPNDWSYSDAMVSDKDQFNDVLTAAMNRPMNQAAFNTSNGGFATGITTNSSANLTLYSLAQCTPDILGTPCHKCLVEALGNLIDEGKTKMSLFMPNCQVMYSLDPFFNIGKRIPNSSPSYPTIAPSSQVPSVSQSNR